MSHTAWKRLRGILPPPSEGRDGGVSVSMGSERAHATKRASRPGDRLPERAHDPQEHVGQFERTLDPQDRILQLLEANGGRMRQSEIVSSVQWSSSTVSRELIELESSEAVHRYQVGREKVVFLPESMPDSVRSPLGKELGRA